MSAQALSVTAEPIPLKTDRDGVVRVGGTRVTLDTLVATFQAGATPEEIVHDFPSLDLADVYAVLTYYLRHRDEVESYLQRRKAAAERIREQNEVLFSTKALRERLQARRRSQS